MKVLAIDENHPLLIQGLRDEGFEVTEDYNVSKSKILEKISAYDGIIIRSRIPVDRVFLEAAVNLKFIGRVGAGLENIDEEFAHEKGIILFNAPEGNRDSVGEHTIGMLLMLMNRLCIADQEVRNGIWKRDENRGDELGGKTIGIFGYGNMGRAFARRLKGFDVRVFCYDIQSGVGDENAKQVSLDQFYKEVDIVSLHTPLTDLTNGMIDAEFIQRFKKPIYIINTARGKCLITKDLVTEIKSGKVKGACLDVLEYEKNSFENLSTDQLPDAFQFLIHSDQVVLTPHIAGWTVQSKEKLAKVILEKIVEWKKSCKIA